MEHDFDADAALRLGQGFEIDYGISSVNSLNERDFVDNNSTENSITFAKRNVTSLFSD